MRYRELLEYAHESLEAAEAEAAERLAHDIERDEESWPRLDWRIDRGRDAYEEHEDEESEEFKEHLKDWAVDRVDNAAGEVSYNIEGDSIRVWRVITAPRDWTPEGRHPGIFWSWDEDAAEAHWGQTGNFFVQWTLEAVVKTSDIDWPATLYQNAHPSFEEEKEIRLKEGTPVKLLSATHDGDLNEAKGHLDLRPIKLRGFGTRKINPDAPATKMRREVEALCELNPLNDDQLVYQNVAVLQLVRVIEDDDHSVGLKDIRAISPGGGKQALNMLCALADKHNVTITLYAKGYANVPTKALVPYYCKFGFEPEEGDENYDVETGGVPMRRAPR